jgi:ATP adenylyltransferase
MPDPAPPTPPTAHSPAALQAPWRLGYLEALGAEERTAGGPSSGSFLRDYWLDPSADERHHILVRTPGRADDGPDPTGGLILLNAFPYASGHLLVALGEPRPTLLDYSPAQRAALWRLTDTAAALLQRTLQPQGLNLGINQGRAAGAGVPSHLHVHLVPRWGGDINFMTAVGNIRIIPGSLDAMAARFRSAWAAVAHEWAGR